MMLSLLCGIITATVHHLFYNQLNGRVTGNSTDQQWVLRIGTAVAFISRLCLAIATGGAYVQWLWLETRRRQYDMASLDVMFAVLGNAFEFVNLRFWFQRPILGLLATITW